MRKSLIKVLMLIFTGIMMFTSCTEKKEKPYEVQLEDMTFSVNPENKTILSNQQLYTYEIVDNIISVTYPDQVEFTWTEVENGGYGSYNGLVETYNKEKYVAGDLLVEVLSSQIPKRSNSNNEVFIVILFIIGIWNAAAPSSAWYYSYGWKYKDSEPSSEALIILRLGGIVALLIGVFLTFV